MSSYGIFVCFLAASFAVSDGAQFTKAADEVIVSADAKQQLMRNHIYKPSEADGKGDDSKAEEKKTDADAKDDDKTKDARSDTEAKDSDSGSDASSSVAKSKGPVSINLYYETRCPDCIMFINQTLEPLWRNEDMRKHLNITMNPYGNSMSIPISKVSEGYKFFHADTTGDGWEYVHISQHGSDEALGNTVQACAMDKVEEKKYMELVFCMAAKPEWGIEKSSYECMTSAGIDPKPIKECATTPEGNKLMARLGKKTDAVEGRLGTPWVLVNGVNLNNVTDLMRSACNQLDNGPHSCSPFANEKQTPADGKDGGGAPPADDGDFTVLPIIKQKVKKSLVQLALNIPKTV